MEKTLTAEEVFEEATRVIATAKKTLEKARASIISSKSPNTIEFKTGSEAESEGIMANSTTNTSAGTSSSGTKTTPISAPSSGTGSISTGTDGKKAASTTTTVTTTTVTTIMNANSTDGTPAKTPDSTSALKAPSTIALRGFQLVIAAMILGIAVALFLTVLELNKAVKLTVSTSVLTVLNSGITLIPTFAKKLNAYWILFAEVVSLVLWILCAGLSGEITGTSTCSDNALFADITGQKGIGSDTLTNICSVAKTVLGGNASNFILFAISFEEHVRNNLYPDFIDAWKLFGTKHPGIGITPAQLAEKVKSAWDKIKDEGEKTLKKLEDEIDKEFATIKDERAELWKELKGRLEDDERILDCPAKEQRSLWTFIKLLNSFYCKRELMYGCIYGSPMPTHKQYRAKTLKHAAETTLAKEKSKFDERKYGIRRGTREETPSEAEKAIADEATVNSRLNMLKAEYEILLGSSYVKPSISSV